jgi:hypothetical protein
MEIAETDFALKAVAKIFDVIVWKKNIPSCQIQWIRNNLVNGIWQLKPMLFKPITCKSTIRNNGFVDVEYFECGCHRAVKGDTAWWFKNRYIKRGNHGNVHLAIHRLYDLGIGFDQIEIEEWLKGVKVDVLGKIGENYIAVELGELSNIDKFWLVEEDIVKELWFGDNDKLIYSLSRKAHRSEQALRKERDNYLIYMTGYYKTNCERKGQLSRCLSSYSAYNCVSILQLAKDLLGIE